MYKFFLLFAAFAVLFTTNSCGICAKLPREEVHIVIKDSTVVNIKDSTVFHHKTVNRDYAGLLDTLRIQGEHSSMKAYADTSNFTIKGELTEEPVKEQFKEKIVYREHRDTLWREKEVPVEVVKEKPIHYSYEKYLWFISLLALVYFGFKFYKFIMRFSGVDISSLLKKK